jgi:3alpha(or 20beta)-hydroxysteroid dehydrogenase
VDVLAADGVVAHDVRDEAAWASLVERFPCDVLVNNAGIGGEGKRVEEQTLERWRRVFAVNAEGVFLGTRAVIPVMRARGGGAIVNVSSYAGLQGTPNAAAYTASKFAVRGFTKAVAMETARDGIRVNSVHPGSIRTPMLEDVREEVVHGKVALDRMAAPEEVARAVLFLASDEASYITGTELAVDGGWSAGSPIPMDRPVP